MEGREMSYNPSEYSVWRHRGEGCQETISVADLSSEACQQYLCECLDVLHVIVKQKERCNNNKNVPHYKFNTIIDRLIVWYRKNLGYDKNLSDY